MRGTDKVGIAKRLNQMGEPNPEAYKKKKGFKYNNPNSDKKRWFVVCQHDCKDIAK